MKLRLAFVIGLLMVLPRPLIAEARVELNVVYGMYSGLALLMDVYHAAEPNGIGIVYIRGSGWHTPLSYDAEPLNNELLRNHPQARALQEAGYTVFAINHRAAPRFRYPAAVEDAQRAVRFVRHHAERYEIDPDRIGAMGTSSGGYLVNMLGVLDGVYEGTDATPINNESSRVQAVAAFAAPADFVAFVTGESGDKGAVTSFVGAYLMQWVEAERIGIERGIYAEASPVSYVSADDPPFLLIHGDADEVVPFDQSERFERLLAGARVPVELVRIPGGEHGRDDPNITERDRLMVAWFDKYLRNHP
jgi:acetyl esterase/lipase